MIQINKQASPMKSIMNPSHYPPSSSKNNTSCTRPTANASPSTQNATNKKNKDSFVNEIYGSSSFKRCSVTSILNPSSDTSFKRRKISSSASSSAKSIVATTKINSCKPINSSQSKSIDNQINNTTPCSTRYPQKKQPQQQSLLSIGGNSHSLSSPLSGETATVTVLSAVPYPPGGYAGFHTAADTTDMQVPHYPYNYSHNTTPYTIPPLGSIQAENSRRSSVPIDVSKSVHYQEPFPNHVRNDHKNFIQDRGSMMFYGNNHAMNEAHSFKANIHISAQCNPAIFLVDGQRPLPEGEHYNSITAVADTSNNNNNNNLKSTEYSSMSENIQLDPQKYPLTTALLSNSSINRNKKKKGGYRCSGTKCNDNCIFGTVVDLAKHLDELQINNAYKCDHHNCFYKYIGFSTSGSLKRHLKIHENGSDVFHCRFCDKSFKNVFNKHRHEKYLHRRYLQDPK